MHAADLCAVVEMTTSTAETKLIMHKLSGVFLRIVMPWFCTGVGKIGIARATRFCTITRAVLRSTSTSNVTDSEYDPSLPISDDMYSIPGTPVTCCSITRQRRHRVRDDLGAGPRIRDRHLHRWRRDARILRDRQKPQRDPARQRDDHGQHRRKDRPIDEELRKHGRSCRTIFSSLAWPWPAFLAPPLFPASASSFPRPAPSCRDAPAAARRPGPGRPYSAPW